MSSDDASDESRAAAAETPKAATVGYKESGGPVPYYEIHDYETEQSEVRNADGTIYKRENVRRT